MKYLLLLFSRVAKEAKRGVEFHHSTRNASKIRPIRKVGNVLTLDAQVSSAYPDLCGIQCGAKKNLKRKQNQFESTSSSFLYEYLHTLVFIFRLQCLKIIRRC